jgi:5-methylcytosine-specific restriction endonuclease McrA
MTLTCGQCSVPFEFEHRKGRLPKWCSPACANRAWRRRKNPHNYAPRPCKECGTVFEISRYGTESTCSLTCHKAAYYKEHKEELDAYRGDWAKRNRDKQGAYASTSKSKKPEHYKAMKSSLQNKRRIAQLGNGGSHTLEEWENLKRDTGNKCLCCGSPESDKPLTRDHIVAVAQGGSDSIDNIQPLCRSCNASKQTKTIDYRNQ